METGTDLKHLVLLDKGQPTSDLTYTLYDQDGTVVVTNDVTIAAGQVSYLVEIPGASNVLTKTLFEQMKLEWTYTTATASITENITYRLHAAIGFPVSIEVIRNMLGVDAEEVPDEDVDTFAGYLAFLQQLPDGTDLSSYITAGDLDTYKITTAIEAATALALLPTMEIRLPKMYNSGTSEYERWNSVDWETLRKELSEKMNLGLVVVDDDIELFPVIDIFSLSTEATDPITGV